MPRLGLCALLISLACPAHAAFTHVQRHAMLASGVMTVSTSTTIMDGDKSREAHAGEADGLSLFGPVDLDKLEIVRLDLDKRFEISARRKRYAEISLSEERKRQEDLWKKTEKEVEASPESHGPANDDDNELTANVETRSTGPGAPVKIGRWTCRPYEIIQTTTLQSKKDPSQNYRYTRYEKIWASNDPSLAKIAMEQVEFARRRYGADGPGDRLTASALYDAFTKVIEQGKREGNAGAQGISDSIKAHEKIQGTPVRIVMAYHDSAMDAMRKASAAEEANGPDEEQEPGLVQPGDLGGGVEGVVGGVAGRWLGRKAEQKAKDRTLRAKATPPDWVLDVQKTLNATHLHSAVLVETVEFDAGKPNPALFEVPTGYKKVKAL